MTTTLDAQRVEDLLLGAQIGVLSSASTFFGDIERWVIDTVAQRGPVTLVHPDEAASYLGDGAMACCAGAIGSLQALQEMPPSGSEPVRAVRGLERLIGEPIDCIAPLNVGGLNCLLAVVTAALLDLPLLDCDGMGRLLPRIDQTTYARTGLSVSPLSGIGPWGDQIELRSDSDRSETVVRSVLNGIGGWLITALYPAGAARLAAAGIPGAITNSAAAGAILRSGRGLDSPRIARQLGGTLLGRRTLTALVHRRAEGPSSGGQPAQPLTMLFESENPREPLLLLEVRNEVVLALVDGSVTGSVPDLVCLLDPFRQRFVDLSDITVGDVVEVLILPADERWKTSEGLRLAGPASFGLDGFGVFP
jgi:DUF917 family protein